MRGGRSARGPGSNPRRRSERGAATGPSATAAAAADEHPCIAWLRTEDELPLPGKEGGAPDRPMPAFEKDVLTRMGPRRPYRLCAGAPHGYLGHERRLSCRTKGWFHSTRRPVQRMNGDGSARIPRTSHNGLAGEDHPSGGRPRRWRGGGFESHSGARSGPPSPAETQPDRPHTCPRRDG
jgi:hypothetical protein